jgi:hypothetical protein
MGKETVSRGMNKSREARHGVGTVSRRGFAPMIVAATVMLLILAIVAWHIAVNGSPAAGNDSVHSGSGSPTTYLAVAGNSSSGSYINQAEAEVLVGQGGTYNVTSVGLGELMNSTQYNSSLGIYAETLVRYVVPSDYGYVYEIVVSASNAKDVYRQLLKNYADTLSSDPNATLAGAPVFNSTAGGLEYSYSEIETPVPMKGENGTIMVLEGIDGDKAVELLVAEAGAVPNATEIVKILSNGFP